MSDKPSSNATQANPETISAELKQHQADAESKLSGANDRQAVEAVRLEYLGRKGLLTGVLKSLKDVPAESRQAIGGLANEIQERLSKAIETKVNALEAEAIQERLATETIDVSMPGVFTPTGFSHPLTKTTQDIARIFQGMGYHVIDDNVCPEIETEYYNFEALNFPPDHPARDMQDTYYTDVASDVLLRSQTSNAQIRYMEKNKPPVKVVAPGRVYRNEDTSSRKHVLFHQLEGLWVAEGITFSDLKGTLHRFTAEFFEAERPTRFRTSFFPFTEPSAEVDVQCIFCEGDGCQVCSQLGWLEILGAGMVDPNVLENVGIDSERYTGFAFGMGIERLAMLKYKINDIRLFFNGDLRFLRQFNPK